MTVGELIKGLKYYDVNATIVCSYWTKEDVIDIAEAEGIKYTDKDIEDVLQKFSSYDELNSYSFGQACDEVFND